MNLLITIENPEHNISEPIERLKMIKEWSYPDIDEIEDVMFRKNHDAAYQYTYGARIFNMHNQKNQIDDFIVPLLMKNPDTRKAQITVYNPLLDSNVDFVETPCIISIFFKIDNDKLNVSATIRSNEMLVGWPANIYQIHAIQKYVASKIGLKLGNLTTISNSAHMLVDNLEYARRVINKV